MKENGDWAHAQAERLIDASEAARKGLAAGRPIGEGAMTAAMQAVYGHRGWGPRDAQEAYEVAMVRHIRDEGAAMHARTGWSWTTLAEIEEMARSEPPHRARSNEQKTHGHYSTPWGVGWAMAEAADLESGERVLEPSAGLGILVALASARCPGMRWHVNEIEPVRHAVLQRLFPEATHTSVDAGALGESPEIEEGFDTVLMNPPFSANAASGRRHDEDVRHLASALSVTARGGRVVALTSMKARPGERRWEREVKTAQGATLVWSKRLGAEIWRQRRLSVRTCVSVVERASPYSQREGTFEWRQSVKETVQSAQELVGLALTELPGRDRDKAPAGATRADNATREGERRTQSKELRL